MKKTAAIVSLLVCLSLAGCDSGPATGTVDGGPLTPERLAEIEAADKAVHDAEMAQKKSEGE